MKSVINAFLVLTLLTTGLSVAQADSDGPKCVKENDKIDFICDLLDFLTAGLCSFDRNQNCWICGGIPCTKGYCSDSPSTSCTTSADCPPCNSPSTCGDPVMTGFGGEKWDFFGQPGHTYSVYTDAHHALNMKLKLGIMHDHNGTYVDSLGYRFKGQSATVHLVEDGNLTLSLDGSDIHIGSVPVNGTRKLANGGLTATWLAFEPGFGHTVTLETGTLKVKIWAVPAGLLDEGGMPQPAYLNFQLALLSIPVDGEAQGLIGETFQRVAGSAEAKKATSPEDDRAFHGQGAEEDYKVNDLLDTDFRFNIFGRRKPTTAALRRMLSSGMHFPLLACNNGMC